VTHGEDANITGSGVYHGHRKYCGTGLQLASEQGHDHIVAAMVLSLPKVLDVNYVREVFMICMRRQCWLYCWCQSLCPRVTSSTDENTGLDDHGVGFDPSLPVDLLMIC
jgi:hypothetical protein